MEWISVKDRLPEYCVNVLTVYKGVVQHCAYRREIFGGTEEDKWKWRTSITVDGDDLAEKDAFTHWMPLPACPTTKEENNGR